MALAVICDCKRKLRIQENLVGKRVRCPHCRHIIEVNAKRLALAVDQLAVICDCKRKLRISEQLIGKKVRCPHCRHILNIIGKAPVALLAEKKAPPITSSPVTMTNELKNNVKPSHASRSKSEPSADSKSGSLTGGKKSVPSPSERGSAFTAKHGKSRVTTRKTQLSPSADEEAMLTESAATPPLASKIKNEDKTLESQPDRLRISDRVAPTSKESSRHHSTLILLAASCGALVVILAVSVGFFLMRAGSHGRQMLPVSGKVSFENGAPVAGGVLTFFQVETGGDRSNANGVIAKTRLDASGTYLIAEGLPAGKYKVVVTPERPADVENMPANWPPFQARFTRYNESPLQCDIDRDTKQYDFIVER